MSDTNQKLPPEALRSAPECPECHEQLELVKFKHNGKEVTGMGCLQCGDRALYKSQELENGTKTKPKWWFITWQGTGPGDLTKVNESNAGGVPGFQIPIGIKQRKKHIDELLSVHEDLSHGAALSYFSGLSEEDVGRVGKQLDDLDYNGVADQMRQHMMRELVRNRMKEVVRKKPGGGGYVLFSPNRGKKHPPKAVGSFPTKLGAKKAELARFPPKDPAKLGRLRKQIDRMLKNPKKAKEKEKEAAATKESVLRESPERKALLAERKDLIERAMLSKIVCEALFKEEDKTSEWDEFIGSISAKAFSGDKKFQKLQKNIDAKSEKALNDSFMNIARAIKKHAKAKSLGVKKSEGKVYTAFMCDFDGVEVGPIYIYIESGVPKLEISDQAKMALGKLDPDVAKIFRAELITIQERVMDQMHDLVAALGARDKYLEKVQQTVDQYIAGLSPLEVSMLKQLLVKKYRKLG